MQTETRLQPFYVYPLPKTDIQVAAPMENGDVMIGMLILSGLAPAAIKGVRLPPLNE